MSEKQNDVLTRYEADSAEKAYKKHKAEAEGLQEEELKGLQFPSDMIAVLDIALSLGEQAGKDLEGLKKMPGFEASAVERLQGLRWALWFACVELEASQPESKRKSTQEVAQKLKAARKRLYGGLDLIWPEDKEIQDQVAKLRQGKGHADLAKDVMALTRLYKAREVEVQEWLKDQKLGEVLEEAGRLSPLLLDLREEEGEKTNTEIMIGLQRRLFFLLQDTYDEIAAAGSYIHRKNPVLAEKYIPFRTAYLRERPASSKKTE